jgi:hypothetical protein
MDDEKTTALIAYALVHDRVIAELLALIPALQKTGVAARLRDYRRALIPIEGHEPRCTELREAHVRRLVEAMNRTPPEPSHPTPHGADVVPLPTRPKR